MNKHLLFAFALLFPLIFAFNSKKPTLYIIGDSTVRNGSGKGENKLWGWGSFIHEYYDTAKLDVENHAIGGRSSKTFLTEGRWDRIMKTIHPGDIVIMQFGHNDAGPLDDTARARGTIRGTGDDSTEIFNPILKEKQIIHTYGWYIKKYILDTKSKGGIPVVCSPVPRNNWKDGKVKRADNDYGKWAKEMAEKYDAYFIDLNNLIGDRYEVIGQDSVKKFFPKDHTHPNETGSRIAASIVVEELNKIDALHLNSYK